MISFTIAIRCITEKSKGYGNFNRCLVIAKELCKMGYNVVFFINHDTDIMLQLQGKFSYEIIPKFLYNGNESNFIISKMNEKNYKILIIDMREYGEKISKQFVGVCFKTVVFDDAWCKNVYSDILINGTTVQQYHKYNKINKKSKIYAGSKYWIADSKFLQYKKNILDIINKKIYRVTITMGGADPNNLTLQLINTLSIFSNVKITVIVGPFFRNITKFQNLKNKNLSIIHNPTNIWKIFYNSDIAISSCGNTLFELAIQNIPTICIPIVEHQILYAEYFESKGFCINLGFWKNMPDKLIKDTLVQILSDLLRRKQMCIAGGKILDGQGLSRVIRILENLILKTN